MKTNRQLKVLVVGAGMYVCGKGTDGFGTILPALYEASKSIGQIETKIAATSLASVKELELKIAGLNKKFGFSIEVGCFPQADDDAMSYRTILAQGWKPDCAIVSVPDHLHFEVTTYLMERGIHCLVVKPLVSTTEEAKKLILLAGSKNLYGAVEFHKRFDRANIKLRDSISQGLIGDPLYFVVEYSQRKSIPMKKFAGWVEQTNIFQYLGIHYVDIIYFATRATPKRAMAIGQKNYLQANGINAYDSIQCIIEWEIPSRCSFSSTILTNWIDSEQSTAMSDQKIKVIGTKGRYEADHKDRGITITNDENGVEDVNPDFCSFYGTGDKDNISIQGYGVDSVHQFLKDIESILKGDLRPDALEGKRPTFKESLVPTMILEAANLSLSKNGCWIDINE